MEELILFSELVKESQKRLIEKAIKAKFEVQLKASGIQVFKDEYVDSLAEDADVCQFVYVTTQKGVCQLRWNASKHRFEQDIFLKIKPVKQ
jgi:hypothetical protein